MSAERRYWERDATRPLEIDGLALILLVLAFVGVSAACWWLLSQASQADLAPVLAASIVIGSATISAWLYGYPRRVLGASLALVALAALVYLPRLFVVDGVLLRESTGVPPSRLVTVIGLNVGGLGIAFLAFLVAGFAGPLWGTIVALRQRLPGASRTLTLQLKLILSAIILAAFPFTSFYQDLSFALLRSNREAVVHEIAATPDIGHHIVQQHFPRLACCGNVVFVRDAGTSVFFPMAEAGDGVWGYLHTRNGAPPHPAFQIIRTYDNGWSLAGQH
ncbi:MAG: hypothetical protein Q8R02_17605 [Hyphomonadaceae bacterium]|nr:hypothetical protein [Hyphomonadaceae bacterium]